MQKKQLIVVGLVLAQFAFYGCKKATEVTSPELLPGQKNQTSISSGSLVVESLTGPITSTEISAFKTYMADVSTPSNNDQNTWVFGNPGKAIEACGLMYEATFDINILNRMIFYCDEALSGRNDLASVGDGGQRTLWTGNIEPVWPSSGTGVSPAQAGVEQGQVLAHLAYCAKLILQNPAIWTTTVSIGDPYSYGTNYKARALKYISESDYVIDNWIIPNFVRVSDKKLYFPGSPNTYKPNGAAPWNQMFMVTNGLIRLVQCHVILSDAATRVTNYDSIVQSNIDWFKANLTSNTSVTGSACWNWNYELTGGTEDTNHAAYDAEGMWIAYNSGRYSMSLNDIKYMANTYFDLVLKTITGGIYAGRVDGTTGTGNASGDGYVRGEYYYLGDVRKDKYFIAANINISKGLVANSPAVASRILWLKNRRYQAGDGDVKLYQNCSYTGWNANFEIGNFNMAALVAAGGLNDANSALRVPPGLKVTLYKDNNYLGSNVAFTADDSCLSDNAIDDVTSSLKVELIP
ncbi:alpha-1,2-mannosidase, putative [Arcticibacter svalbardensis MN12-7]|uniref:Alpha-1,2-mannosidase, putative n=1 Tax=Arcticibacter svalbardensis MN12-7 TaxID=1150600 RepID=R9GNX5_9SPHI|nr:hypothetical protein [Arcticibacter svalbardensis]EOR93537.1 alpha-1,2-mannosidase, putative [Arcticibacter svalbardensis MN12-7]